jgi:proteic killer suppression protein
MVDDSRGGGYTRVVIRTVTLSSRARKDLRRCPAQIVRKLMAWVGSVQLDGLEQTRKLSGYHDEPLHGPWRGHRSVRLSRSYRAIYAIRTDDAIEFVLVETINQHRY